MKRGFWRNGKREITGHWLYQWASDTFLICLDSQDRITGQKRTLRVSGDKPEWGNWKLTEQQP